MQEKEGIEELLTRAIETGQSSVIKRIYGQKDVLLELVIPGQNENQNNPMGRIRALFMEALRTPAFLKCEEGRKFLALLFGLIDVESLHSSIKSVLGRSTKTTGDHYGDIYYRAWKNATDESRPKIEEVCIQDLLNLCVTCRQPSVVSTLCHVIKAFTKQKHQRPVESMLARLLQPILWRNIAMPNSKVRLNATSLFFMVYPVRDGDLLPDERNALYRRQQDAMHTLLDDPCPTVRVVAVRGVCRVLCDYWNTLSSDDIKRSLKKIIDELSKDQSSVQVRTAVFDGLRMLVDCNSAVDALKKLLPRVIRFGVNDSSDKVRLAAVQVLIGLKGHRLIKFWNVLDMKTDLIPRLAIEPSPLVAKALVKLVFNSYCPQGCSLDSRLFRIIELISLSGGAARVFHRYAGSMMSVQDAVKHLQMMLQFVYMRVRQERDAHEATSNSSVNSDLAVSVADLDIDPHFASLPEDEKENANADYSAKNLPLMSGLVDCVAILWTVVRIDLHKPAYQSERVKWQKIAARMLPHIMRFYTDSRMSEALLYIGSMLPESEVKYLSKSVIKKLKNLEQKQAGKGVDKEQRSLLEAACAWRFEELVKMIEEWLQDGMNAVDDNDMDETTRPRKKVKFTETEAAQPRPQQGLRYLLAMLNSPTTRQRLIAEYLHILPDLFARLASAQDWLEQNFSRAAAGLDHRLPMECADLILCLKLRSIIAVLLGTEKNDDRDERVQWFEQQVRWLDENVIQRLVELNKTDAKDDAIQVCKALLFGLHSALLAGLRSDALEVAIGEMLRHLLDKDETVDFLSEAMDVLHELAESVMHGAEPQRAVDIVAPTIDCLLRFIVGLLGRDRDEPFDNETTTAWAKSMHDILATVCCRGSVDVRKQFSDRLLLGVTFASLHNLSAANAQISVVENPSDDGFTCPKLTDFLIRRIVSKNAHFVQCVASQLLTCIESGVLLRGDAPLVRMGGAAQLVVLLLEGSKAPPRSDLRRCREALDRQLAELDQSFNDDEMLREVRTLLSTRNSICI